MSTLLKWTIFTPYLFLGASIVSNWSTSMAFPLSKSSIIEWIISKRWYMIAVSRGYWSAEPFTMKSSSLNLSEWAIYFESWREVYLSLNSKSVIILSRLIRASLFGSVFSESSLSSRLNFFTYSFNSLISISFFAMTFAILAFSAWLLSLSLSSSSRYPSDSLTSRLTLARSRFN